MFRALLSCENICRPQPLAAKELPVRRHVTTQPEHSEPSESTFHGSKTATLRVESGQGKAFYQAPGPVKADSEAQTHWHLSYELFSCSL